MISSLKLDLRICETNDFHTYACIRIYIYVTMNTVISISDVQRLIQQTRDVITSLEKKKVLISETSPKESKSFKLSDYPNVRLGYACINETLKKNHILINKSCIAKTFKEKGIQYAIDIGRSNLKNVLVILRWNEEHNIKLYRMSSSMFPHLTNPTFIENTQENTQENAYAYAYAYALSHFEDLCKEIGRYVKKHNHRLTFHPGQFNQIGTPDKRVYKNTATDLSAHSDLLDMMGIGDEGVLVVHGGGTYGDKKTTLKRWVKQFYKLPIRVQRRVVIENCERCYSVEDMLELSALIKRPVVFDTHHHHCFNQIYQKALPEHLENVLKTWNSTTPKFHISEQDHSKRIGAHSDYVECIPDYLIDLIQSKGLSFKLDIMIEAKKKELAVNHLKMKYI